MSEKPLSDPATNVLQLLQTKCRFEVRAATEIDGKRFRVLGKIPQTKVAAETWHILTTHLLHELPKRGVGLDLSRQHFLIDEEQRWAWRLIFSSLGGPFGQALEVSGQVLSAFSAKPYVPLEGVVLNNEGLPSHGVVGLVGKTPLRQETKYGKQPIMRPGGSGNG